jgi:hypothetical protein
MMWYFIEDTMADLRSRMLIDKPYPSYSEAEQAAIANSKTGQWRIVSFPTRDKRKVRELWRMQQQGMYYR